MPWETIQFWHWLALGALLIIAEILAPGVFLLWLGVAAAITGVIVLGFPDLGWGVQLILFGCLSVASVLVGRVIYRRRAGPTSHPNLNRRGKQYVGQVFTLEDSTVNGRGRVHVGDTLWNVAVQPAGHDLDGGTRVTVTGADGSILLVESAHPVEGSA
jgi:membrane protein implicated in regulation of membrane protease activity